MTDRVILGQLPSGGYGLRVSLPGVDVHTALLSQLAFSSEDARFGLVLATGSVAYQHGVNVDVPFGTTLSFIPAAIVYGHFNSNQYQAESDQWAYLMHDRIRFPWSDFAAATVPIANYSVRYIVFGFPIGGNAV